jgi:uncharacterized protein YfbU (UPF0304 family)
MKSAFQGFDANASGGQYSVAKFLRRTQGKWSELSACPDNSHSGGTLDSYRRILSLWNSWNKNQDLTVIQIDELTK